MKDFSKFEMVVFGLSLLVVFLNVAFGLYCLYLNDVLRCFMHLVLSGWLFDVTFIKIRY